MLSKRKPKSYDNVKIPEYLKVKSTKELLAMKLPYSHTDNHDEQEQIRAELTKREHVPNKAESKRNRTFSKKHGCAKSKNR